MQFYHYCTMQRLHQDQNHYRHQLQKQILHYQHLNQLYDYYNFDFHHFHTILFCHLLIKQKLHLYQNHYLSLLHKHPKHHQQDRGWLPFSVNLGRFAGGVVRIILAASSGPAGDGRFDWAGWAEPQLQRPVWP